MIGYFYSFPYRWFMKKWLFVVFSIMAFKLFSQDSLTATTWVIKNDHRFDIYFMCRANNIKPKISAQFTAAKYSTTNFSWKQSLPEAEWVCVGYDNIYEPGADRITFKAQEDEKVVLLITSNKHDLFFKLDKVKVIE
jgi:hypothetical protein